MGGGDRPRFARGRRFAGSSLVTLCALAGAPAAFGAPAYAPVPGSPFASTGGPAAVAFSPNGGCVAAGGNAVTLAGNAVSLYTATPAGVLTPVAGSPFATPGPVRGWPSVPAEARRCWRPPTTSTTR